MTHKLTVEIGSFRYLNISHKHHSRTLNFSSLSCKYGH
jgi:hypothetical protein